MFEYNTITVWRIAKNMSFQLFIFFLRGTRSHFFWTSNDVFFYFIYSTVCLRREATATETVRQLQLTPIQIPMPEPMVWNQLPVAASAVIKLIPATAPIHASCSMPVHLTMEELLRVAMPRVVQGIHRLIEMFQQIFQLMMMIISSQVFLLRLLTSK